MASALAPIISIPCFAEHPIVRWSFMAVLRAVWPPRVGETICGHAGLAFRGVDRHAEAAHLVLLADDDLLDALGSDGFDVGVDRRTPDPS
jgi:hypothetical protein